MHALYRLISRLEFKKKTFIISSSIIMLFTFLYICRINSINIDSGSSYGRQFLISIFPLSLMFFFALLTIFSVSRHNQVILDEMDERLKNSQDINVLLNNRIDELACANETLYSNLSLITENKYAGVNFGIAEERGATVLQALVKAINERSIKIEELSRNLEIENSNCAAMKNQIEQLTSVLTDIKFAAGRIIEGDLSFEEINTESEFIAGETAYVFNEMTRKIKSFINESGGIVNELASASEEMSVLSWQMNSSASNTSIEAEKVSANAVEIKNKIHSVLSGTEQMSMSINEISRNANDAVAIVSQAVSLAGDTSRNILTLGEKSLEIGKVVKVVSSIASQTNLLALNASIEAARSGKHGKGFAVVANEVKKLAKETTMTTEEISAKIETIQQEINRSGELMQSIVTIINTINDHHGTIAASIEQQTATTTEIKHNISDVTSNTTGIAESIESVSSQAKSTGDSANGIFNSSNDLVMISARLKKSIGQFSVNS